MVQIKQKRVQGSKTRLQEASGGCDTTQHSVDLDQYIYLTRSEYPPKVQGGKNA